MCHAIAAERQWERVLFSMCSYLVLAKVVLSIGSWVSSHLVSVHGLRIRVVKTLSSRRNLPQFSEELRHIPSDWQARLPAADGDGTTRLDPLMHLIW